MEIHSNLYKETFFKVCKNGIAATNTQQKNIYRFKGKM